MRTVLITGSSRGIGLASAVEFLKKGDRVCIFCRHQQEVDAAAQSLQQYGKSEMILGLIGDVRNVLDVENIIVSCVKYFGTIDVLVNNAGVLVRKNVDEMTEQEWDDTLNTNLKGSFLFIQKVLPIMKQQGSGVIVNISSGLGERGMGTYAAYCASKFGLIGLTQSVAEETKQQGIKVYAVLPGAVATKLNIDAHPDRDPNDMMTPEHIAEKIVDLAQGKARTGSLVRVYR